MADKAYTSAKANGTAPTAVNPRPSQFAPPTKIHLNNPARHPYRPTPSSLRRDNNRCCSCRRCCFFCCCWSIIFLIFIILLACIAVAAVYFLYHPKTPTFSISSFKISQFNLTTNPSDDTTRLTTKLNLTLSSKNPNKKIIILYDPITIKAYSNQQVLLANGSFPAFVSPGNNVTIIHTTLAMASQVLDADSATALRSDLKKKTGVPMELVLETKVKVKFDKVKVRKFGVVVTCQGIHALVSSGKNHATQASTSNAKCKVDLRFKIWKVTL